MSTRPQSSSDDALAVERAAGDDRQGVRPGVLLRLMRPTHWVKNVLVLLPVVFAMRIADPAAWLWAGLAAAAFCLAASAVYIVNDIRDAAQDGLHPVKCHRPIASGAVSPRAAWGLAAVLTGGALGLSLLAGWAVLVFVAAYLLLQAAYTTLLKYRMLVDVMAIAMGFVLRAVAGAVAIRAEVSPWLVICAFTLCLFMGFCKRRNEMASINDCAQAERFRATLAGYTPELLTHLITLSAGVAIVAYLLYATS
ncbi:MAG: UbiA prenyltransferase family protein, partial [Planctomycetota bacterium]